MPIFYPIVATKLTVRFDESLLTGSATPAPTLPEDAVTAAGMRDRLSHSLVIIPKTASIELPSVRQAQKFNLTFAFKDFPVDARAIRAMEVEIYIGTITSSSFSRGMLQEMEGARLASQFVLTPGTLMLVGLADNITTTYSDKGSEVQVDGRGLQGMMLDWKVHADIVKQLTLQQTIDQVIQQLLDLTKAATILSSQANKKLLVHVNTNDWPDGLPRVSDPSILSRAMKGADGTKTNKHGKGDPNSKSVWDLVTNLCADVGAVPYFITNQLWVRPAKSIFTQRYAGGPNEAPTPFSGGEKRHIALGGGKSIDASYRKMVYGRNLLTYKMERKFGGVKVPVVKVISCNLAQKGAQMHLEAQYPPESSTEARASSVAADGSNAHSEPLVIYQPGIIDLPRLQTIAEQIHNEIGRGELGGSASTKDLASLGGNNADTDLLTLRPGDAIEFAVDAAGVGAIPPTVSELNTQAASSSQQLVQRIVDRLGFDEDLAKVLVGAARGQFAGLQNTFRVANVKYTWDIGVGIAVDFDFQNYIEARYDPVEASTYEYGVLDLTAQEVPVYAQGTLDLTKRAGG